MPWYLVMAGTCLVPASTEPPHECVVGPGWIIQLTAAAVVHREADLAQPLARAIVPLVNKGCTLDDMLMRVETLRLSSLR